MDPSPICVQSQKHSHGFPLKLFLLTPTRRLFITFAVLSLIFAGSNMTHQPPVHCRDDSVTWEASGLLDVAAPLRQAGGEVRLLGSHLFPRERHPRPWEGSKCSPAALQSVEIYQGQGPMAHRHRARPEYNPVLIHPASLMNQAHATFQPWRYVCRGRSGHESVRLQTADMKQKGGTAALCVE